MSSWRHNIFVYPEAAAPAFNSSAHKADSTRPQTSTRSIHAVQASDWNRVTSQSDRLHKVGVWQGDAWDSDILWMRQENEHSVQFSNVLVQKLHAQSLAHTAWFTITYSRKRAQLLICLYMFTQKHNYIFAWIVDVNGWQQNRQERSEDAVSCGKMCR